MIRKIIIVIIITILKIIILVELINDNIYK